MFKRRLYIIITTLFILILSSCSNNENLKSKYDELYQGYEKLDINFHDYKNEEDIIYYLNDEITYQIKDVTKDSYTLVFFDKTYSFKGQFKKILSCNNKYFVFNLNKDRPIDRMRLEMYELSDCANAIYDYNNCVDACISLTYYNDYYYLIFFNESNKRIIRTKLNLSDIKDKEENVLMSCEYVSGIEVINPYEFYYVSLNSLYYYKDNFDGVINYNDYHFVQAECNYIYNDSNINFFTFLETNIVSNSKIKIVKYNISNNDSNFEISKELVYEKNFFMNYFYIFSYMDYFYSFFEKELSCFMYDASNKTFKYYYDLNFSVLHYKSFDNTLVIKVKDKNSGEIFYKVMNLKVK